jgi:hypothetical protein
MRVLASIHIAHFHEKRKKVLPLALDCVNAYLTREHWRNVSSLPELVAFRDVPNQAVPEYIHEDESLAWLVNQALSRYQVPMPIEKSQKAVSSITVDDAFEIVCHIDFDSAFDIFATPKVAHLASVTVEMTAGNRRLQVSNRFIDYHVSKWLHAIRLPFESDKAHEHAGREIWNGIISGETFFVFALKYLRPMGGRMFAYDVIDNIVLIDGDNVNSLISGALTPALPVVYNLVPNGAIDDIAADDFLVPDSTRDLWTYTAVGARPVDHFQQTDKEGEAAATDVLNDSLFDVLGRLPFKDNIADRAAVVAVSLRFLPQCDLTAALPPPDTSIFEYFHLKHQALYASFAGEYACAGFLAEIAWPLADNTASSSMVSDVLSIFDFTNVTDYYPRFNPVMGAFIPRDPVYYGNPADVTAERSSLWLSLMLPVVGNAVSDLQLFEITDVPAIFDISVFVRPVLSAVEIFEFDDTHLYTSDATVAQVIDGILCELDPDLPLDPNLIPSGVIDDVVSQLSFWANPLTLSPDALEGLHPWERVIDFRFPPLAERFFWANVLPLSPNGTNAVQLSAILECLDSADFPLAHFDFPLADSLPLVHFEAPIDSEEDLTALAYQLIAMILRADIAPFVPVMTELAGLEFNSVLNGLIDVGDVEPVVAQWRIERMARLAGPTAVPRLVRPEDVVTELLWGTLLPQMPLRTAEIDELIAAAVDDLTIEEAEIDSAGPLPNEVEALLTKYGARGRGDTPR